MNKTLNTKGLGVSGRQNELIELALTYKFDGVEVDMDDLVGRHNALGKEFACQFLQSAKIEIGSFALPIDLGASDEDYQEQSKTLDIVTDLASTLGGKCCFIRIETTSDTPFQENFEQHRLRLAELGDRFAKHDIRIGLALQLLDTEKENKFVQTVEEILTLVKTVGHANVGLCLDTWHWSVAGGSMEQVSSLDHASITELRMADVLADADLASIKKSDRELPGTQDESMSVAIFKQLQTAGYEGPVSIATELSSFARANRDDVVSRVSKILDRLIANESINDPEPEEVPADADADGTDKTADVKTETKSTNDATKDDATKDGATKDDAKDVVAAAE